MKHKSKTKPKPRKYLTKKNVVRGALVLGAAGAIYGLNRKIDTVNNRLTAETSNTNNRARYSDTYTNMQIAGLVVENNVMSRQIDSINQEVNLINNRDRDAIGYRAAANYNPQTS
jgi:hypothetical protein